MQQQQNKKGPTFSYFQYNSNVFTYIPYASMLEKLLWYMNFFVKNATISSGHEAYDDASPHLWKTAKSQT